MHDVPIWYTKSEIALDFHVFEVQDFDILMGHPMEKLFLDISTLGKINVSLGLLIGYPIENLLQEKSSQGSLNHDFGKTSFATPISCLEIPMAEHHLDHKSQEEVMFVSPLIPPNIASPPDPLDEASLKEDTREELSNGKGHFSEAVWIDSPSTIIPCSIRGISIEAQLIPNLRAISCHGTWHAPFWAMFL